MFCVRDNGGVHFLSTFEYYAARNACHAFDNWGRPQASIYCLARTNAVCVVGVFDVVKLLELSTLFPSQRMTEIGGRVALSYFIIPNQVRKVKKNRPRHCRGRKNEKLFFLRGREALK